MIHKTFCLSRKFAFLFFFFTELIKDERKEIKKKTERKYSNKNMRNEIEYKEQLKNKTELRLKERKA